MNATASTPASSASPQASPNPGPTRRVIDAPTRMFHWLFALSFAGAYLSAESEQWHAVHVTLGYGFGGLLLFRLLYGLVGPRAVRWAVLRGKLAGLPSWLREGWQGAWREAGFWRQGQNRVMAIFIATLLLGVLPLVLSGHANHNDWAGLGEAWEELHEFFGNALLAAALAHIGWLLVLSLWRRRNLAWPMVTGRMEGRGPDLLPARRWLAALLLIAFVAGTVAYWVNGPQADQAAGGGGPGSGSAGQRDRGHDDDDDDD